MVSVGGVVVDCYLWDGRADRSWGSQSSRDRPHRLRRQRPENLQANRQHTSMRFPTIATVIHLPSGRVPRPHMILSTKSGRNKNGAQSVRISSGVSCVDEEKVTTHVHHKSIGTHK